MEISDFVVAGVPKTGVTSRRVKIMTLNKFIDVIIFEQKSELSRLFQQLKALPGVQFPVPNSY